MSWVPPFKLDPHVAVRAPDTLPILMQRGIHDLIERGTKGDAKNKGKLKGSMHDKFMIAFNYIAKSLTDSGRLRHGTLDLTPKGVEREKEAAHLKDTKMKLYWLDRWATKLRAENPSLYAKTWWQARDEGGG